MHFEKLRAKVKELQIKNRELQKRLERAVETIKRKGGKSIK